MKTTIESLVVRRRVLTSVFYFERGPTMKEVGHMAIDGRPMDVVLVGVKYNVHHAKYNFIVSLHFFDLVIDTTCDERRFLFEAKVVSYWPFAIGGAGERRIQGCLDQNRQGLFIFYPNAHNVYLV